MPRRPHTGIAIPLGLSALLAIQAAQSKAQDIAQPASDPVAEPKQMPSGKEPIEEIGTPIPQDLAKQRQQRRDMLAWHQKAFVDSYNRIGKKDPRWDDSARKALALAARLYSHDPDPDAIPERIYESSGKALITGCRDALVYWVYARESVFSNYPGQDRYANRLYQSAIAMSQSDYPAILKMFAWFKIANRFPHKKDLRPVDLEMIPKMFDDILALLPKAVADKERGPHPKDDWSEIAIAAFDGYRGLQIDTPAAFERTDAALAKIPSLAADRLTLKGHYLMVYAWEARGSGVASTITDDGWKKFRERLADSRKALEEAWKLKPGSTKTAIDMITVNKGLDGDREDMEEWFKRAMEADGDCFSACAAKLDWLDPKWHGSVEEMLTFGRACLATKNWEAGLPLLYVESHVRAASTEWRRSGQGMSTYFKSPELQRQISEVFGEYLRRYPSNNGVRSDYAACAFWFGQYDLAEEQFRILGEDIITTSNVTRDRLVDFRTQIEEMKATRDEPPKPKQAAPKGENSDLK